MPRPGAARAVVKPFTRPVQATAGHV